MSRAPRKPPLPPPDREADAGRSRRRGAPTRTLVLCPRAPSERRDGRAEHGRLAEAVGLAQAIDLHVVAAETVPLRTPRPATLFGSGGCRPPGALVARRADRSGGGRRAAERGAAAQSRARLVVQGDRPDRPDPRDLRGARAHQRGPAAGGAGGADLPALAPGALVDPPRAAARRLRFPGRAGRIPDRARPAAHRRSDHPHPARARSRSSAPAACTARRATAPPTR